MLQKSMRLKTTDLKSGIKSFTSASRNAVKDKQVCLILKEDFTLKNKFQITFTPRKFFRLTR